VIWPRYYRRSSELISYEQVTGWLYHLIKERQLSASSVNIAVSAVRFLYAVTLGRDFLQTSLTFIGAKCRRASREINATYCWLDSGPNGHGSSKP
jgi:hypothetical protein